MSRYPGIPDYLNGCQLRAARTLLGWNQKDLGCAANLSPTIVSRVERGANVAIDEINFGKIVDALGQAGIRFLTSEEHGVLGLLFHRDSDLHS